jgi:hypothetical protein
MTDVERVRNRIEDLFELLDLYKNLGYDIENPLVTRCLKELEVLIYWLRMEAAE